MKKIIVLSFVLAALIFFGLNVNSSVRINNTNIGNSNSYIHYQVNIHPDWDITHSSCPLMVSITDGSNRIIGQSQLYHPNMNTYHFYEMGPVSGKRMAKLSNVDEWQPDNVCTFVSLSDSKSGTFNNGWNYMFDLYASVKEIIKQDNSTVSQ